MESLKTSVIILSLAEVTTQAKTWVRVEEMIN